jgi:hypothetical protein
MEWFANSDNQQDQTIQTYRFLLREAAEPEDGSEDDQEHGGDQAFAPSTAGASESDIGGIAAFLNEASEDLSCLSAKLEYLLCSSDSLIK